MTQLLQQIFQLKFYLPYFLCPVVFGLLILSACSGSSSPESIAVPSNDDNSVATPVSVDQHTVMVQFDITVPAYQSNELLVVLDWGDTRLNAQWIGDEYWSATADLASGTEQRVSVKFYDSNGSIELALATRSISVGSNATEVIQITADQFDDTLFDLDMDGDSNLEELIAGKDPTVDELAEFEVVDHYRISQWSRMSVSHNLEAHLTNERPFYKTFELDPDFPHYQSYEYLSVTGEIDIDKNGNGTYYYRFYFPLDQLTLTGTRTHSDDAITWEGSRSAYDGDYRHRVDFTNTVSIIDDNTRLYAEEISVRNVGTYDYRHEYRTNLIGERIEGTSLCKPVAGSIYSTYRAIPGTPLSESVIRKEKGDRYWKAASILDGVETVGLLFRDVKMYRLWGFADKGAGPQTLDDDYFICDFPEFD